jgi:hypothetical protein
MSIFVIDDFFSAALGKIPMFPPGVAVLSAGNVAAN